MDLASGLVETPEQAGSIMRHLMRVDWAVVDTETTGLLPHRDLVCGVVAATELGRWYFPFRHGEGPNLPLDLFVPLGRILHSRPRIYGYNYKFDAKFLANEGIEPPSLGTVYDAMLAGHLLDENTAHKLETRAALYGLGDDADESAMIAVLVERYGCSPKVAKSYLHTLPAAMVAPYALNDVHLTLALMRFYEPHLKHYGLETVFQEVCQYAEAVTRMELHGMTIDTEYCEQQIEGSIVRLQEVQTQIFDSIGHAINLNSHVQVRNWLQIPSASKDRLIDLMTAYPERTDIDALMTYRHLQSANNVYYAAYLESAEDTSEGPKIFPDLNLVGTVSGRPSCKRPNLLNIPRNSEIYAVRNSFVASPGHTMIEFDLSQAEMRIAAHLAREHGMSALLDAGADAHQDTANRMKSTRAIAKNINFSFLYGIGAKTFSERYHVTEPAAKQYLTDYGLVYPGFRRLLEDERKKAQERGYVRLYTGRMRHYNCFKSWCRCFKKGEASFSAHPKDACNNLIQGTVSEMIRKSIVRVHRELPMARQLLTIYDSLILEVPHEHVDTVLAEAPRLLEANEAGVTMRADCKLGDRWGSLKERHR